MAPGAWRVAQNFPMIVQTKKVSKIFQEDAAPITALAEISVDIKKGSFMALCGPSGSGKTTLLNLIGCLDRPTSGEIWLDGAEISKLPQARLAKFRLNKIGFIFQDFNLIPTLNVSENIEYVLWLQGVPAAERRRRSAEMAERFGIGGLLARRPSQISRGQQQRVAVARALVHKPLIVLGDEFTANLDHKTGTALMDFLKDLNHKEKMTFVYATHDPIMMERAERIVRMQDGRVTGEEVAAKT